MSFSLCRFQSIHNPICKFNNNLLEYVYFCKEVKLIEEIVELAMSFLSKWESFKFNVWQVAIKMRKYSSKLKKQKQLGITIDINKLCCKAELSLEEHGKLNSLQSQLDYVFGKSKGSIYTFKCWGNALRKGENNSYFLSLENQTQKKNSEIAYQWCYCWKSRPRKWGNLFFVATSINPTFLRKIVLCF